MDKERVRTEIQSKRSALTACEIKECSNRITEKILQQKEYLESDHVFVYMEIKNEVSTKEIIKDALMKQKKVSAPKIIADGTMEFMQVKGITDLSIGTFGILEPEEVEPIQVYEGESVFMLIPGLAYDRSRNRIGFGKGYYDRYLEKFRNIKVRVTKVAVAYDFQILDDIKAEIHDQKPDFIITPTMII